MFSKMFQLYLNYNGIKWTNIGKFQFSIYIQKVLKTFVTNQTKRISDVGCVTGLVSIVAPTIWYTVS